MEVINQILKDHYLDPLTAMHEDFINDGGDVLANVIDANLSLYTVRDFMFDFIEPEHINKLYRAYSAIAKKKDLPPPTEELILGDALVLMRIGCNEVAKARRIAVILENNGIDKPGEIVEEIMEIVR